jgi:hypothetical protein
MHLRSGASGAERLCALGVIGRFCAALHHWVGCLLTIVGTGRERCVGGRLVGAANKSRLRLRQLSRGRPSNFTVRRQEACTNAPYIYLAS